MNRLRSNFFDIKVDGKDVSKDDYEYSPGSVIIKLKPEYLETISVGEHTLTALFEKGKESTSADFYVLSRNTRRPVIPQTGTD